MKEKNSFRERIQRFNIWNFIESPQDDFANCNVVGILAYTFDDNNSLVTLLFAFCLMMYPPMLRPIIMINNNDFLIFLHVIFKSLLLLFDFESHNVHISFGTNQFQWTFDIFFFKMDSLTLTTIVKWLLHILWNRIIAFGKFFNYYSCSLFEFHSAFLFVLLSSL